eukprot:c18675_g1_i1 orf=15-1382(-)
MTGLQTASSSPSLAIHPGEKARSVTGHGHLRHLHQRAAKHCFSSLQTSLLCRREKISSLGILKCSCTTQEASEDSSRKSGYGGMQSHGSIQASLLSKLNTTLQTRDLLHPQQKVLVAVSGGQDSISLIFLLKKLQDTWGWKLGIAHCDHQWSSSSRPQASHVAQVAAHLKLDFYQAVATRNVSGESAARTWRYGILHRIASYHGYSVVVTAHTGSDRVETLLHNLFRGSGLHGLQALTWRRWLCTNPSLTCSNTSTKESVVKFVERNSQGRMLAAPHHVALVRPLLDISRKDIRQFCDVERLPLWPDPSNFSMDIQRNKIRHQLLPFLRENLQASVDKSLTRWAEIVCGEDAFLEDLCHSIRKQAESSHIDEKGSTGRKLSIGIIRNVHVAVQRRVIKQFVETFSNRSLGFDHVEHLRITCIVRPCKNGTHFSLPGNIELQFLDDNFLLHENRRR